MINCCDFTDRKKLMMFFLSVYESGVAMSLNNNANDEYFQLGVSNGIELYMSLLKDHSLFQMKTELENELSDKRAEMYECENNERYQGCRRYYLTIEGEIRFLTWLLGDGSWDGGELR